MDSYSWPSCIVYKWASVLSSSFILNRFNYQCWALLCIAVESYKFLCSTFWSEGGKNTIASLIWCLMEQLLSIILDLKTENLATRQRRVKWASCYFLTKTSESTSSSDEQLNCLDPGKREIENWFLLSPTEKTRQHHILSPWNSRLAKTFHLLKHQGGQSSKQASIYTKYQFLWWHRFLSHGMITKTRNFPEPNTVSLLSEDGEGKPNLMKICFTLWWIFFNLKKKKYNNRTNTATANFIFWRIFVTQSLDEKLTQCIRT